LEIVRSAGRYLDTVSNVLEGWSPETPVQLVLYNAGMDPFEGCDVGGLPGITEQMLQQRERMVFDWTRAHGLPVAFVLAGGYVGAGLSRETLVTLHRHTLRSAAATPAP
jgi:acetoin utilization deacetylase AcuC-like enzyme